MRRLQPVPRRAPVRGVVRAGVVLVGGLSVLLAACGGGTSNTSGGAAAGAKAPTTTAAAGAPSSATPAGSTATAAPAPAASAASAVPTTAAAAPCRVAYLGDSVGYGTYANGLSDALAKVGCPLVWSTARPGMETSEGAQALTAAGDMGANVVVASVGYVNAHAHIQKGEYPGLIDQVVKAAGDRVVIWPLLGGTSDCSGWYAQSIVTANQMLQQATKRWPNLVLADYPSFIAAHPEYSQNRCPHLIAAGYQARAQWLAAEVRRLVDARAAQS